MGGFKTNSARWVNNEAQVLRRTESAITQVILHRGIMLAPVMSGDLIDSGKVEDNPQGGKSVIFGGQNAPHGRLRHFENQKNPQTLHYLKNSGDSVAKEPINKYVELSR